MSKKASVDGGLSANGLAQMKEANTGRRTQKYGTKRKQPQVRKVNDFIVYLDEVLGEGQYGKVCKAQLASDLIMQAKDTEGGGKSKRTAIRSTVDPTKRIYACKIIEIADVS